MTKPSTTTRWINWLIPLLLICVALGFLLFYQPDAVNTLTTEITEPTLESQPASPQIESIASDLVNRYFNGTDEEKADQLRALQNTLIHLSSPGLPAMAQTAFDKMQQQNLQAAIHTLIELAGKQKNTREAGKTWIHVGNIQNLTSNSQALLAYQKASSLDPDNSNAWNRQATLLRQMKRFDEAEAAYRKVQQLANQTTANKAFSLANFGLLNQSRGDYAAAKEAFEQSLKIYTEIENKAGIASTSANLASLHKHMDQPKEAERYYLQALNHYLKLGQPRQAAGTHAALGSLYQSMNEPLKAQQQYEQALEISLQHQFEDSIADLYSNLGLLAQQNNQLEQSRRYFEQSLQINQSVKRSLKEADQYGNLAIVNRSRQNFAAAEKYHQKAIAIYTENKHLSGIISQQINLGFLYKAWKKNRRACSTWQKSLASMPSQETQRAQKVQSLINQTCPNP